MFFIGLGLVSIENLLPLIGGDDVFLSGIVEEGGLTVFGFALDLALCNTDALGQTFFYALLFGHELGVATQQNVGSAACHIGRDGYGTFSSGLGDDLGLTLVELGIQHHVLDALLLQEVGEALRLFN